jgi:hypothetical protein
VNAQRHVAHAVKIFQFHDGKEKTEQRFLKDKKKEEIKYKIIFP